MYKALEYTNELIDIYNRINSDYQDLVKQEQTTSLYEQDILHIIENTTFNAADGYKLAKMIKDNRNKRRKIKNELRPMKMLKDSFINNSINSLKKAQERLDREAEILSSLSENAIYSPRTQEVDGGIVTVRKTASEKRILQEELKSKFVHNANTKKTRLKVCVLAEINERQTDCILLDSHKVYHRLVINKDKLIQLDKEINQ